MTDLTAQVTGARYCYPIFCIEFEYQTMLTIPQNANDNDTFSERPMIGEIKSDNMSCILSNDKGYGQYVHVRH